MAKRRTKAQSGEDRLISRYLKPIARHPGALGLTDDAALLAPPAGHELVLTADAIVGGVHFFPDDPPDSVALLGASLTFVKLMAKAWSKDSPPWSVTRTVIDCEAAVS